MLHGSQEFEWDEPVCDGDVIETAATCKEIYEKDGKGFYVFETISTNQEGEQTVKGTWTNIVRGESDEMALGFAAEPRSKRATPSRS